MRVLDVSIPVPHCRVGWIELAEDMAKLLSIEMKS